MIHFKITPDSRLDNKQVEQLAQSLCIYTSPLERWNGKGFARPPFMSFETILEKQNTSFILTIPKEYESLAKKALETSWTKSAIEKTTDPFTDEPQHTSQLTFQQHYMFALKVNKSGLGALPSLLEVINTLEENEKIYIQTIGTPAEKDWFMGASSAYERFKKGEMPQKFQFNKKMIANSLVKMAAYTALEMANITTELITGKEMEKIDLNGSERAVILKDGKLSTATLNKTKAEAYETEIRIGVVASKERATSLIRMVTMAFRELDGENQLIPHTNNRTWKKMKERKIGNLLTKDYYSIAEISRLHVLPTGDLQEKYNIPHIDNLEMEVDKSLTTRGICFGEVKYKKDKKKVFYPITNYDELCLPRVVIGKMGQGKSSYSINFVIEAVNNGFGALVIDPAKRETGNEIELTLPKEKIIRIDLGKQVIGLDWREVFHGTKAKNRLANTIISFFNTSSDEAGPQTTRFLRAAVMAMKTGKLSEIMRIFEEENYRNDCIKTMKDGIHKTTLLTFGEESESRQRQILNPIYNRLDLILGDEYLEACMNEEKGLDMVELMASNKAVIIDVPKKELGPEVIDLLINILSSKIDLAMALRDEDTAKPYFVIFDELHQMQKSTKIWKSAAVESRKYRVGYVFLFHTFEQVPKDLREIIKSAGPHYAFYNSSKATFKEFKEELSPFTVEDFIKLKRFHAINIINAENEVKKPFIALMSPPPSIKREMSVSIEHTSHPV